MRSNLESKAAASRLSGAFADPTAALGGAARGSSDQSAVDLSTLDVPATDADGESPLRFSEETEKHLKQGALTARAIFARINKNKSLAERIAKHVPGLESVVGTLDDLVAPAKAVKILGNLGVAYSVVNGVIEIGTGDVESGGAEIFNAAVHGACGTNAATAAGDAILSYFVGPDWPSKGVEGFFSFLGTLEGLDPVDLEQFGQVTGYAGPLKN